MPFLSNEHYSSVIVLPVYNEEVVLRKSVINVYNIFEKMVKKPWAIVIVDNGSTDKTVQAANELEQELNNVFVIQLLEKGKGLAIRKGWQSIEADFFYFTDIDLSADLFLALPKMISSFDKGVDVVIGSRFVNGAKVKRKLFRCITSYGYRIIAKIITQTNILDLPCGLKAVRAHIIYDVIPEVQDQSWFFDSELVLLSEAMGYKIEEIPVNWEEARIIGRKSHLPIIDTAIKYFQAIKKIRKRVFDLQKFNK